MLTVTQLSIKRRARSLFQPLSFQVLPGEILTLTGPNGVGKTTLLKSLMGLTPYHRGQVHFNQTPCRHLPLQQSHYLGHQNGWLLNASVWDNLTLQQTLLPHTLLANDGTRYLNALQQWALLDKKDAPVYTLSAGQKRALSCCALSLNRAPLWLLDEPYVHLSTAHQAQLSQCLAQHLNRQGSIVMVLHDYPRDFPHQFAHDCPVLPLK